MKAIGIIAEYNPFHKGHKYLLERASALTEADVCVSVMSGNFVQRGGPAFFDKWSRAELAVKNGVDLVVELPQCYSASSASYFASAGVRILESLNCDHLVFGSENGDIGKLTKYAEAIRCIEDDYMDEIKAQKNLSFPAARAKTLNRHFKDIKASEFSGSNDILGIEYLNAIHRYNAKMKPLAVKRRGGSHISSATEIRKALLKNKSESMRIKKLEDGYFDLARYRIMTLTDEELASYDMSGEGLENKLKKEAIKAISIDGLIDSVKTKRYTRTRISRLISQIVLDIHPDDFASEITYIRPLAFSQKGKKYLKEVKRSAKAEDKGITVIEDVSKTIKYSEDEILTDVLKLDIQAGHIYQMISGGNMYEGSDYVRKPFVLSSDSF